MESLQVWPSHCEMFCEYSPLSHTCELDLTVPSSLTLGMIKQPLVTMPGPGNDAQYA